MLAAAATGFPLFATNLVHLLMSFSDDDVMMCIRFEYVKSFHVRGGLSAYTIHTPSGSSRSRKKNRISLRF